MPGAAALGLAAEAPPLPPLVFNGVVGQRYKVHLKKGFNLRDPEGTNPNIYYFIGTYVGSEPNPAGQIMHAFGDVVFDNGFAVETFRIWDHLFIEKYAAVPNREGGSRKRRSRRQQHRNKRRSTRGGRRA